MELGKKFSSLALVVMALAAAGCTRAGFGIANLPTHGDGIEVRRDIVYDAASGQALDIYLPPAEAPGATAKGRDVIVFFYGGRWTTGSKGQYAFAGSTLAQRGFVVVIPDYRKYDDVKFPVFVQDAAAAVAWTHDNITAYGGNPARLNVAGHSSGAHLGALVAADASYLAAHGKTRDVIHRFAGLAGPYAFTPDEKDLVDMFGPPENYPRMQVTTFIDGGQPPMLLLWGDGDEAVGRFNLERLQARIKEKGGVVESRVYAGVNHVWIVGALSWLGKGKAPVVQDMTDFLRGTQP